MTAIRRASLRDRDVLAEPIDQFAFTTLTGRAG